MHTLEISDALATTLEEEANAEGVSRSTILEGALRHYRRMIHKRRLEAALRWYTALPEHEQARYSGKFVAVYQDAVVDHGADRLALYKRVRAQYGHRAVLIIPAEGPLEFSIISTRIEAL